MKRISLGGVLIGGMLAAIVTTVAVIQTSSWISTRAALIDHARDLMDKFATDAIDHTTAFLTPARTSAQLAARLIDGDIVPGGDPDRIERLFFEQLRTHSQLSGLYLGSPDGGFLFVKRDRRGGIDGTRTKRISAEGATRRVENVWRRGDFSEIERALDPADRFDPRVRPWYVDAQRTGEQVWTDPYLFFTSEQPGITTAIPLFGRDRQLVGVVGVDIEIGDISGFLGSLDISPNGSAFLTNRSGEILAYPKRAEVAVEHWNDDGRQLRFARVDEIDDPRIAAAYRAAPEELATLPHGARRSAVFEREGARHLVEYASFPAESWPWLITIHAPEADFLGDLQRNQLTNAGLAMAIALLACLVAWWIARQVTRPVRALRGKALQISGALEQGRDWPATRVRELSDLIDAFRGMEMNLLHERDARQRLADGLRKTSLETMMRMAVVAEYKDEGTAEHIDRMSLFCREIARHMGYDEAQLEDLRCAAVMHDIGKVAVPDEVLRKPGPLNMNEMRELRIHPEVAAEILRDSDSEVIELARVIALTHHERWDGSGYPFGLKGRMVPLAGRISAVADVFDALVSERHYKQAIPVEAAIGMIRDGSGTLFDPAVVAAFDKALEGIAGVLARHPPSRSDETDRTAASL